MQTQRLQTSRYFSGFDGLRLVAALSVIFSHAFLIATGSEDTEPFVRRLGPNNSVGLYGVFTFFIISGFLSLSANASANCLHGKPGVVHSPWILCLSRSSSRC
jgi:peptidoglycan/LPS O-acetylase OafA/YrhL